MNKLLNSTNADVGSIFDLLKTCDVDNIITYQQINKVCLKTKDIINQRGALSSALRKLRNVGYIFICERNIGYKRLSDVEIINQSPLYHNRIRHILNRNQKELDAVNDKKLEQSQYQKKIAFQAAANIIIHLTKPKMQGQLLQKAMNSQLPALPEKIIKLIE